MLAVEQNLVWPPPLERERWQESESFLGASPFATITIAKRLKNLCNLKMAEVSAISYGNVQLILISLLAGTFRVKK